MQEIIQFLSNHAYLTGGVIAVFVVLTLLELIRSKRNTSRLSPPGAVQLINHKSATVIDTRTQDQYSKGHIIDALYIPSHELSQSSKKIEKYKTKPIILVCNSGIESQKITTRLTKEGYNAYSLAGGMRSWYDAGLPVVKE